MENCNELISNKPCICEPIHFGLTGNIINKSKFCFFGVVIICSVNEALFLSITWNLDIVNYVFQILWYKIQTQCKTVYLYELYTIIVA